MITYRFSGNAERFMTHHRAMRPDILQPVRFHQRLPDMTGTDLVVFTSPDCGSCRHLQRVLLACARGLSRPGTFWRSTRSESGLASEFEVFHLPDSFSVCFSTVSSTANCWPRHAQRRSSRPRVRTASSPVRGAMNDTVELWLPQVTQTRRRTRTNAPPVVTSTCW